MKVNNTIKMLLLAFLFVSIESNATVHCGIAEHVYRKVGRADVFYMPHVIVKENAYISGEKPLVIDKVDSYNENNVSFKVDNPVFFKKFYVACEYAGNDVYSILKKDVTTADSQNRIATFDPYVMPNINGKEIFINSEEKEFQSLWSKDNEYRIDQDFGAGSINVLNIVKNKTLNLGNYPMIIPVTASMTMPTKFTNGEIVCYVDENCTLDMTSESLKTGTLKKADFYLQNNAKVYQNVSELRTNLNFCNRPDLSANETKHCKGFACFKEGIIILENQTFNNNQPIFEGQTTINCAELSFGTIK